MCKYCNTKNKKFDDYTGGRMLTKGNKQISLGVLGSVETELNIVSSEYQEHWSIDSVTLVNIGTSGEFEPYVNSVTIKYCPFCGRELI